MNRHALKPLQPGDVDEAIDVVALGVVHNCGGELVPTEAAAQDVVGCLGCQAKWKLRTFKSFSAEELARRFFILDDDAEIERTRPNRLVWRWADAARSAYTLALEKCWRTGESEPDGERFRL